MNRLLVITGPTATGKTKLGIELAKKFDGEIVSADSRQVYMGMDVETGKDRQLYEDAGVKVWGLDIVEPGYNFNVSDFVAFAKKIIADISQRGKLPIVVGGTGQYIKELLDPSETLHIPPDLKLRAQLEKLATPELQKKLMEIGSEKWKAMNGSDRNNPRRLVRAIEVAASQELRKNHSYPANDSSYNTLLIGLAAPRQVLYEKIVERRKNRPDLVEKEFKLALKQLLYLKKYLPPAWFDIAQPNYRQEIFSRVEKWYTKANGS